MVFDRSCDSESNFQGTVRLTKLAMKSCFIDLIQLIEVTDSITCNSHQNENSRKCLEMVNNIGKLLPTLKKPTVLVHHFGLEPALGGRKMLDNRKYLPEMKI